MESKINIFSRILILIVGFAIMLIILFLVIDYDSLPFSFIILGYDISLIMIGCLIIIFSIAGMSLIKSGLLGKWKLD